MITEPKGKAVVLLSGGLDSTTCLHIAKERGHEIYALSFRYGQRHEREVACAKRIANTVGVAQHLIAGIDLKMFGGSALTDDRLAVPHRTLHAVETGGVPITYVPARNTIFLSFALAWAEVIGAKDIYIGVNRVEYSGYPDCSPEYIGAYQFMANVALGGPSKLQVIIQAPLMFMDKKQIVQWGARLGADYSATTTCYDPWATGEACGRCDACLLRLKGFCDAGLTDPIPYNMSSR